MLAPANSVEQDPAPPRTLMSGPIDGRDGGNGGRIMVEDPASLARSVDACVNVCAKVCEVAQGSNTANPRP